MAKAFKLCSKVRQEPSPRAGAAAGRASSSACVGRGQEEERAGAGGTYPDQYFMDSLALSGEWRTATGASLCRGTGRGLAW